MKCPSGCEEPRAPCNMEKAAAEFAEPSLKTSPLKGCVRFMVKPQSSPCLAAPKLPLNDNTRGVRNKENKEHKTLEDESLNCDGLEDSGYQSLQNSHIETEDEDHDLEEQLSLVKPPGRYEWESCAVSPPTAADHSDSVLPILKFQRAVCHELTENFKRTQSYDWTVISKLAKDHSLEAVIGGRMGRECVDVLAALLEKNMRHILTVILGQLGEMDLIICRRVSRTWRTIISQDKSALHRCQQAEQRLRMQDSRTCQEKENVAGLTRSAALSRVVLSCMQTVASSPAQRSSSKRTVPQRLCAQRESNSQPSRFRDYQEAASSLKQHESLKRCEQCGSPARHHAPALRATCTRQSCAFDFCTRCQGPFHGSAPCRSAQVHGPTSTSQDRPILIGSVRSRRNVRRL